jgi:hypothetical protein
MPGGNCTGMVQQKDDSIGTVPVHHFIFLNEHTKLSQGLTRSDTCENLIYFSIVIELWQNFNL